MILTFSVLLCAQAQQPFFERIDNRDGLPQNTVNEIIQDSRGFMWFGTKDGLGRYDGKHFKNFHHIPFEESGLGNSQIRSLAEDMDHNIWVGTNSGLYVYYTRQGKFEKAVIPDGGGGELYSPVLNLKCGPDGMMLAVVEGAGVYRHDPGASGLVSVFRTGSPLRTLEIDSSTGTIWFSWSGDGLFYTDDCFRNVYPFLLSDGSRIYPEDIISAIRIGAFDKIYLGMEENGVVELDKASGIVRKLNLSDKSLFVREIMQYSPDELWIGTESGLYVYNTVTGSARHLVNSPYDSWSLSDNAVHSICKDRDGGIWIGTFFGGVSYLPKRIPDFNKFYYSAEPGGLKGRRVRKICPDRNGCLWVATEDAGLWHFNPADGQFRFFAPSSGFSNVQELLMDGDNLWVSTFSKGIRVIDTRTMSVKKYEYVATPGPRLFSNNIFALARTGSGRIYIGTMHGLQFYNRETDDFGYVPQINGGKMVNDIKEDSRGNLWVATLSNGLYMQQAQDGGWRQFLHDGKDRGTVPGNNIISIFEDSGGRIWITTYGDGFSRYDPQTDSFCTYTSVDGMPSDVVYQIIEDESGDFWITTNRGLVLFNPHTCKVERIYTSDDGLLCDQFNYNSGCMDMAGNIYFGCIDGMVSFSPRNLKGKRGNSRAPEIYVTEFSVLNENPDEDGNPLENDITCTDSIVLRYSCNSFTMQLAALGFSEDYALLYRMDGVDASWRRYDNGYITYSNVPSGEYMFRVKFAENYSGAGEKTLYIKVRPPVWRSPAANVLYLLVLAGAAIGVAYFYHRTSVLKRKKYIKAYEIAKEREVYNSKIAFFTGITHEIRTPLTLIKGPLDNILSKGEMPPKIARDLDIMRRNTDRLLVLVNQLLDFQKIEKENLSLELARENIPEIIEDLVCRFSASMSWQHRDCRLSIPDRDICSMVNREAFTKIVSNLLNNAMKYSQEKIEVTLEKKDAEFILKVANDGDVVPADKREAIFAPFYRYSNIKEQTGTGIGLYLARSLAELQKGTLVMSDDLTVNEFVLTMPLCADCAEEASSAETEPVRQVMPDIPPVLEYSRETVLVVEDDMDMCEFIRSSLEDRWKVLTAHNGKEALDVLDANIVTIIVSDIMMPQMDGIELCRIVKSDIRYTHIPLVLLTAKTTLESKIEGMNVGADAYVEKPFSLDYLMSVIANQINGIHQLREAFRKNPLATMDTAGLSPGDAAFITKLEGIIHENLANSRFKMDHIAEMMGMSRANFYRKIKGVLDMTPNDYLRLERLKKAAQLLAENDCQVNEISYMVGISAPSYFIKLFYRQFGMTPGDFVKKVQNKAPQKPEK